MSVPEARAILPASSLVTMPPRDSSVPAAPAMASISGVICAHLVEPAGAGAAAGWRCVEPVDIGEQHEAVGAHHAGHARRQPVVVAVADFAGGHRVVLVDDGDGTVREQGGDGLARVEIAPALLGVAQREQDLRRREAVRLEHGLVGAGEGDLADGRRSLRLFQLQRPARKAQYVASERDGAGGDQDHLPAGLGEVRHVAGERIEPGRVDRARRPVDEQARPDLDDDASGLRPLRAGVRLRCVHARLGLRVSAGAWLR